MQRFSRVTGLSETGISAIHFDVGNQQLWIGYNNSNIDVLESKSIRNIPDLKRATTPGDKTIFSFYTDNDVCYASTGLGIVVLNSKKYEIRETWIIGSNGRFAKTFMFAKDNNYYYAATEEGLKRTSVSNPNPSDFRSWQNLSGNNGLSNASSSAVVNISNRIITLQNDSLFIQNDNSWNYFFSNGMPISSVNVSDNKINLTQKSSSGSGQVVILNIDGSIFRTIQHPSFTASPSKALSLNGHVWIADEKGGLSMWTANSFEHYKPNAPESIASGNITISNNTVYVASGGVTSSWLPQQNPSGVFRYREGQWLNYNHLSYPQLAGLSDATTVAVDPRDESVWAGSFGGGLFHLTANNQFRQFRNPEIGSFINDPSRYAVSGLAFDNNNNLWIANFGASQYLRVLKKDNTWLSFNAPFGISGNAVSKIIIDDADQKWIISPLGNGLISFNHGASIDDKNDDKWRLFRAGRGNGNLPSNQVLSIAKDKNGFIWVGTNDGIGIIECPHEVFSSGCEAVLPVAQQGNFAGYLFKGEEVRSIAVDGANRKWIGTKNGVWLVSDDGSKTIERFTETNSPLLSNDVNEIAVDGSTGEVFISTTKGIISFRGAATEGSETFNELIVYPNPVPPSYTGTIAIKGLKENSYVKITELNGRLVFQSRALGGQAIWNGRDLKGNHVSSGVYLVLITDAQRQERAAGKIVFIAK